MLQWLTPVTNLLSSLLIMLVVTLGCLIRRLWLRWAQICITFGLLICKSLLLLLFTRTLRFILWWDVTISAWVTLLWTESSFYLSHCEIIFFICFRVLAFPDIQTAQLFGYSCLQCLRRLGRCGLPLPWRERWVQSERVSCLTMLMLYGFVSGHAWGCRGCGTMLCA